MRESDKAKRAESVSQVELQDLGGGHWRAVCGDRSFRTDERDGDLWVDHRELSGFVFGLDSHGPGNMAQQIERSKSKGLILPSEAILVIQDRNDGKPGKKSKSYLLRRNAALIVATQCALLPSAGQHVIELTRKMADVFEQWLDRRHHPQLDEQVLIRVVVPVVTEIAKAVVTETMGPVLQRLTAIEDRLASQDKRHGLISRERRREILDEIQFFADCFYNRKTMPKEWRKKRGWYEKEVRKAAKLALGMGFDRMSESRDEDVEQKLRDLREAIPEATRRERVEARDRARQSSFSYGKN